MPDLEFQASAVTADRDAESAPSARALALERLLPALVHRLNNALTVVQGVLEVGAEADAEEHAAAGQALAEAGRVLRRLGALVRPPGTSAEVLDLGALVAGLVPLLAPYAASVGVELELRVPRAPVPARAPPGFEAFVVVRLLEELAEARARDLRRLRLAVRAQAARARLVVAGAAALAHASEPSLPAEIRLRRRLGARSRVLVLELARPAGATASLAPEPRPRRARVLLLQPEGEPRRLTHALLVEHGYAVVAAEGAPEQGQFELVLLDAALAARDPDLFLRLASAPRFTHARFVGLGRWPGEASPVALEKPVHPRAILGALLAELAPPQRD